MGYFNFYFLRKLFYNKNFRKIFFIILCFIFFFFVWNNVVNADYEFSKNDIDYVVNDLPSTGLVHTLINTSPLAGGGFRLNLYYSSEPFFVTTSGSGSAYFSTGTTGVRLTYSRYYINISGNYSKSWTAMNVNKTYTGVFQTAESYNSLNTLIDSIVYCDSPLTDQNGNIIWSPAPVYENFPYFLNSAEDLAIGNEDLIIMPGDFPNDKVIAFTVQEKTETSDGQGGVIESWNNLFSPLQLNNRSIYYEGVDDSGVGYYYVIPWEFFKDYLQIGNQYCYVLAWDYDNERQTEEVYATYGGLTPEDAIKNTLDIQNNLLEQQLLQIEQMNQNFSNLIDGQSQTTTAVENLENTITDDTITSGASDLPSIDLNNPSEAPLDNIFMIIYNAFCTGNAQDIVFPIPFTNKNITLSPYYVRDMLNNNGGSWVVTFADAFWQFVIALFIIRDVSKKVNKIKAGDIENIENTNIKEDML